MSSSLKIKLSSKDLFSKCSKSINEELDCLCSYRNSQLITSKEIILKQLFWKRVSEIFSEVFRSVNLSNSRMISGSDKTQPDIARIFRPF